MVENHFLLGLKISSDALMYLSLIPLRLIPPASTIIDFFFLLLLNRIVVPTTMTGVFTVRVDSVHNIDQT